MQNGKICYVDRVDMDGMSQKKIFKGISKWAKKNYAHLNPNTTSWFDNL